VSAEGPEKSHPHCFKFDTELCVQAIDIPGLTATPDWRGTARYTVAR